LGYGKESEIAEIRNFVASVNLSDKITLLSYKENAMEYLAQADLILIGSQEFESFGLTAIEAMKYHKVILSTNIGGLIEVNKDGEGSFLFNPDDCSGMAQKAISLLTDDTLMQLQSELAYKRYSLNFRASIMSIAYKNLMK
jgi:glycosyltransferase involved in cell wall biosynthesis